MTAILALLPIFGYATIYNIFFKKNVSVSIFFSISSIISILFIFGMFEFLQLGTYLLFYGGILLLLIMSIIYNNKLFESLKSVPFVMFTVISIVYLYLMQDAQFFFWDEYSHWGAFIKYVYNVGAFYDTSCTAAHLNYPPGITLWDYFIVLPTGFKEGSIYFGYFLIIFSSTLMMYEKLRFKDIHWIFLVVVIQITLYASFGHWLSCIYVDHIIGSIFAGLVLAYLSDNFKTKELFLFLFPLITIVLIKDIGLYFGLAFLGLVLLFSIVNTKLDNNKSFIFNIKLHQKMIAILLVLFLAMVIVLKSWSTHQESKGILKEGQTMTGVIKNIFSDNRVLDSKTEEEVKKRFWNVVNYQQLHKEKISLNYNEFSYSIISKYKKELKLSTTGVMIFFILMFILYYSIEKDKNAKIRLAIIYPYILIITLVYLLILFFSFQVAFGNGALRIPSFVRYMNMGVLPMLLIGFSFMLPLYTEKYSDNNSKKFLMTAGVIIILGYITTPYLKPMYSQLNNGFRQTSDKISLSILKNVPAKSKLFVIFPIKNNGSLNNILRYSLIPIHSTISKYDFQNKSSQEMLNIYSKYEYIWFVQLNKKLIEKNKVFLKGKANNQAYSLYKIEKTKNNIKFIPII